MLSYSKAKNKYIVKDSYIKYNVTVYPTIKCQCKNIITLNSYTKYCPHVLKILKDEFKLSDFVVKYLYIVYTNNIYRFMNYNIPNTETSNSDQLTVIGAKDPPDKNLNDILFDQIIDKFKKEDCGFCIMPLTEKKFNLDLFECSYCNHFVHTSCNNTWLKKPENKGCIFCRQ